MDGRKAPFLWNRYVWRLNEKGVLHLVGYDSPELVLFHHKAVHLFVVLVAEEKKALNNRIVQQITIFVTNNHIYACTGKLCRFSKRNEIISKKQLTNWSISYRLIVGR